jgi:hypothetical protein
MDNKLPNELIEQYFMRYAGYAKRKSNGVLNGGCPICREDNGKYWKKRSRLYFVPENQLIYCHNCNRSWFPINWIKEVSGLTYKEILKESQGFDYYFEEEPEIIKKTNTQTLPYDSINLFDPVQLKYYETNPVVRDAVAEIKRRRLDTATNKTTLYISLKDFIHKNRLCIPFYDSNNKIPFYQTRALYKKDETYGKYLSKMNSEKTIFGLNKIDSSVPYLFMTEGPIDCMFVSKNGASMGGLSISALQRSMLSKYIGFELIWILDNQLNNEHVFEKYSNLLSTGERVFIWPKLYKNFKDINELCVATKQNSIKYDFFLKNSYTGKEGLILINLNKQFSQ